MELNFSGHGIKFLSHFRAVHDVRYYLQGIFLRPMPDGIPGVVGVASDGHTAGLWYDESGKIDREIILHIDPAMIAHLAKHEEGIANRLAVVDGRLAAIGGAYATELFVQPKRPEPKRPEPDGLPFEVKANFPDIVNVMSHAGLVKEGRGPTSPVHPKYLERLNKCIPKAVGKWPSVTLVQPQQDGGIYALFPSSMPAIAIVMPLRYAANSLPEFVNQLVSGKRGNRLPG